MRKSAVSLLAVLAAVTISIMSPPGAHADGAPPPVGSWVGTFPDGSQLDLVLQADGSCMYGPRGGAHTVGTASWSSTYAGGILTLTYFNAGQRVNAYYSVTWVNGSSFSLSDPYFRVLMRRS